MKQRDYSLDAIKGLSCIFMILAHVWWSGWTNIVVAKLSFFGNFAPILFYAVTGVTSTFQAKRTPFKVVLLYYIIFAILGFSLSASTHPNLFYNLGSELCNILQIISIGAVATIFIEKFLKPHKNFYLILAIFVFLAHYLVYIKMGIQFVFPLWPFIFASQGADNLFPTVPWTSFFFLGVYAQSSQNKHNLFMGTFFLLVLIGYELFMYIKHPGGYVIFDKFSMDTGYFILSVSVLFLFFYLFKAYNRFKDENHILLYLGKNSLLFLYVHLLLLDIFKIISSSVFNNASPNAYLAWISILVLSVICMKILQNVNSTYEIF